jgi:hypothetical protein
MALVTLGTNATTSLQGARFVGGGSISNVDVGAYNNLAKDDIIVAHPNPPDIFMSGILTIPNRGWLKVLPGDYIAIDANGWPILVSAYSIATGGWTHT